MVQTPIPRRFTVSELHAMATSGILGQDERVELIEGEVVTMAPIGPGHGATVDIISAWLHRQLGTEAIVRTQGSVQLSTHSEPLPDIAVLIPRADHYRDSLPAGPDIRLIIEVSDSSIQYDRSTKIRLYAAAGIPETWVVDLVNQRVETYWEPAGDHYKMMRISVIGETLRSATIPGLSVAVATLF